MGLEKQIGLMIFKACNTKNMLGQQFGFCKTWMCSQYFICEAEKAVFGLYGHLAPLFNFKELLSEQFQFFDTDLI